MNIDEIKAAKEIHYRKAKEICRRYYENEIVYSHTFMEQVIDVFVDTRPKELHLLIGELKKIESRIKELDKYLGGNDENN